MISLITTILLYTTITFIDTKNTEDLQVGDWVYSYDTTAGEVSQRQVTATFERRSDHLNYLTIIDATGKEQTLETTDGHPFWVVTNSPDMDRAARDYIFENGLWLYHEDVTPTEYGYWVEAKDLKVGDVFLGANGELSTLTNIVRVELDDEISVFNFSVEGNHNYFVLAKENDYGQTCILVHNSWNYGLIDPTNIRYSQDSIKRSISGPSGTIDKLRDGLKNGTINPKDLPPIKIDKNGFTGEIYSLDNRRLWAAKEAGTKVNAQWATNADVHNALKQGKSPAGLTVNIIDK